MNCFKCHELSRSMVIGLVFAVMFSVRAGIFTENPVADSYVRSTEPGTNHGADLNFIANNNNGVRISFLRFDMSGVTNPITRLKLELTVNIASSGNTFDVFGLTNGENWDEMEMVWTNAPAVVNSFAGTSGTQTQCFRAGDCYGDTPLASFVSTGTGAGQVDSAFNVTNGAVFDFVGADADKVVTFVIVEQDPVDVPGNAWNSREAGVGKPLLTIYTGTNASSNSPAILKVYLQGGQSNSDGRALTNGLPVSLFNPQNDVPLYYYLTGGVANGDGTLGTLTTLRPGISALGGGKTFGPELTFGRTLADYYALTNGVSTNIVTVAIIKYAHGGTSLVADWTANGNSSTNGDGPDYVIFQKVVSAGLSRLAEEYPGTSIELDGMIWVQGESDIDAGSSASTAYGTNLVRFIKDVRATYAASQPYGTNLPFFLSRISANQTVYSSPADPDYPNYLLLRAGQQYAATNLSDVYLIDTDPPQFSTATPWSSPGLHFDTQGQRTMGSAFGQSVIKALPPPQLQIPQSSGAGWLLNFTGVSGTVQSVEGAINVTGPWVRLTNILVGPSGITNYQDAAPAYPSGFYRVSRP